MRYAAPIVVLVVSAGALVLSVGVLLGVLVDAGTGPMLIGCLAVAMISFAAAAWATGRIRRLRSLTPEAIIRSAEDRPQQ
jgi:lipopolysaccharide export LptBFGC system permease protein LptF